MKKISNLLMILSVAFLLLFSAGCEKSSDEVMRHVVMFKFKPGTTDDQIKKITTALGDLEDKIPGIVSFEHGVNDSDENSSKGFTHVYLFTFEDAAARDNYLPHPEHQKFVDMLGETGVVEDVFVVDYIPEEN